jgi:peptidyl-prolyl cis-trans isomerase A (cyclophilin A)
MKLQHTLLLPALAAAFAASAYAQTSNDLPDAPAATAATLTRPNGPTVVMDTSMGRITCQFYQKQAPKAVANFIGLAEGTQEWTDPTTHQKHHKPFFNGTIFHRVIPGFMIQGGDPTGTGMGGPGYRFQDETKGSPHKFDKPGKLAMANSGPGTNGCQFFITVAPTPHLTGNHTIFGEVVEGQEIVTKISLVPRGGQDKPKTPVVLESVVIERVG